MKNIKNTKVSLFIVIPARYASSRLPAKPLLSLGQRPLILHVLDLATKLASQLSCHPKIKRTCVIVATDHPDIAQVVIQAGGKAVITDPQLANGTERVFSALQTLPAEKPEEDDIVVNLQGDEPFLQPADIAHLVESLLSRVEIPMGTLAFPRHEAPLFFSSSVVKVVRNSCHLALYFSRAPIPYPKEELGAMGQEWLSRLPFALSAEKIPFLHHVGVYVFRYSSLQKFINFLPVSFLEKCENLEQLRALEAGWDILVCDASSEPFGIDTPEDLKEANRRYK